jgi:hypothetical protein
VCIHVILFQNSFETPFQFGAFMRQECASGLKKGFKCVFEQNNMHAYVYVFTCMHVHACICIRINMHACACMHTYTYLHACMNMNAYVYILT